MDKVKNKLGVPDSKNNTFHVDVHSPINGKKLGSQNLAIELVWKTEAVYHKRGDQEWITIGVNLDQSYVSPGMLACNQNDIRGYYLNRYIIMVWPQIRSGKVSPDYSYADQFKYLQDSPKSMNQDGSITSSVSFSANAQGGAMAGEPMAMLGAGVSIGTSHTHAIKDFTFANHTQGSLIVHSMEMTNSIDDSYDPDSKGHDLYHPFKQSPFVGTRLDHLPTLATSNAPIATQAYWHTHDQDVITNWDKVYIGILVAAEYILEEGLTVGGGWLGGGMDRHAVAKKQATQLLEIDLSGLR